MRNLLFRDAIISIVTSHYTFFQTISNPAIIIFIARDIVLSKIIAGLDFNKDQVFSSDILNPVPVPALDINGLPRLHLLLSAVAGKERIAVHDEPVFRPTVMALQAHPLARIHGYALHLVVIRIDQIFEKSPWPAGIIAAQCPISLKNFTCCLDIFLCFAPPRAAALNAPQICMKLHFHEQTSR